MLRLSLRRWTVYTAASLCCFTALCLWWYDAWYLNRRSCTCAERNHGQAFLDPQSSLRNTTRVANAKVKTDLNEERTTTKKAPLKANINLNAQTASLSNKTAIVSVEHVRPENCSGRFQSDFPLLADQPELCEVAGGKAIDMLFMVVSAPAHRAQRDAIRKSWASVTLNNTSTLRHVFTLGTTTDAKLARQVEEEARDHRDVVVHGFRDAYGNLTLKVIASLRWLVTRCKPARYFMKVDDDVWINTASVTSLMTNNADFLQRGVMGECSDSYRPHRSKKSKWHVTKDLYPADRYPPYCLGLAYFSSMGVAKGVVAVSPTIPFFQFEDVYVGMCLQRLGFGVKNHDSFRHRSYKDACQGQSVNVSAIHSVAPSGMQQLWNAKCWEEQHHAFA